MREIKFRAWDKKENKMYHNVGLVGTLIILEHELGGYDFCEVDLKLYDHLDDNYNLMQYTGLKDKNGKEIYEGDIVKHTMNVRVDTRRLRVGRSYQSYGVYEDKEITGVVEEGFYDVGVMSKKIPCLIVKSSAKTSYDSYFWGEGKRTDEPKKMENELSEPLFNDKEYEVIGNIYENPNLIGEQS